MGHAGCVLAGLQTWLDPNIAAAHCWLGAVGRPGKDRHFHSSLGYFDQTTIILHLLSPYTLELQTKVREDFTIKEQTPTRALLRRYAKLKQVLTHAK